MMRLIDADELKTAFPCGESVRTECVRATIDHMPTIKPEPERKIELHGDESAIEILSELRSWFSCFDEKEGLAYHALSLAIRAIKANSTAEPERKGKWIGYKDDDPQWKRDDGSPIFLICSECHETVLNNGSAHWNFCPNCGADMTGGEENDER